jgi:hypothetical protein
LLFIVAYEVHDNRRATGRFTKWTPPAGFEFKGHWVGVNGTGFALVDAASAGRDPRRHRRLRRRHRLQRRARRGDHGGGARHAPIDGLGRLRGLSALPAQPTPRSEVEIVIAWHEALNDRDVDRLVALCSDDVEVGDAGDTRRGPAALRRRFDRPGLRLDLVAFLQRRELVLSCQEAEWLPAGGAAPSQTSALCVFRIESGLIVSVIAYRDLEAAMAALD